MKDRLSTEEFREQVLNLLAQAVPFGDDTNDEETPDAGVPTAVLIMVEWQATDGNRWLSCLCFFGNGSPAPRWTTEMLAKEALEWSKT
jgi:hypothetical protein